jgi:hypothetical protein
MARKWSNLNLPGVLHYVTGNCIKRIPVFSEPNCCRAFLRELNNLNREWPSRLIAYVLMPDISTSYQTRGMEESRSFFAS